MLLYALDEVFKAKEIIGDMLIELLVMVKSILFNVQHCTAVNKAQIVNHIIRVVMNVLVLFAGNVMMGFQCHCSMNMAVFLLNNAKVI